MQVTDFHFVARKYKLYNKLRISSSCHPSKSSPAAKQKPLRPAPPLTAQTPRKHTKHNCIHPFTIDPYDSPLSARKNTPSIFRTSIGPTPQKDGWVLGIFDFLSPESDRTGTPSKNQGRPSLASIPGNSLKTPSKKKRAQTDEDEANTPSSKRVKSSLPATLFTPSAARRITTAAATPSSRTLVGLDDTPFFLKRHYSSAHPLNDDAGAPISWSPEINVRMRTKPVLKGLSQLVRGLREMADQELDAEMELLREIEGDEVAPKKPNFAAKLRAATANKKEHDLDITNSVPTLVRNSLTAQTEQNQPLSLRKLPPSSESIEMPLGPDRALDDESEEDSTLPPRGRDGKPLRAFKKRGQKRSTRMSKMRPSKAKWQPEPVWKVSSSDEAGKEGDGIEEEKEAAVEVHVVEETQLPLPAPATTADDGDDDMLKTDNEEFVRSCHSFSSASVSDEEDLSGSNSKNPKPNTTTNKKTKSKMEMKMKMKLNNNAAPPTHPSAPSPSATTTARKITTSTQQPNEMKQQKKKKIAPTAHANFRALKIHGKGSAGGKGGKKYSKGRGRR